jgi:ribosomal protein S18 acetylase RimI-like enzyme
LPKDLKECEIHTLADLHMGDAQCDYKLIKDRVDYIAKTPNAFCILNGDLMNNATKTSISDSYAELLDGIPIGLISLSQKDHETETVKCGYRIESSEWGKGYATKAFALIIKEAQKMGFKTLTCSILKDNNASVALWKRQGAALNFNDTRVIPILKI